MVNRVVIEPLRRAKGLAAVCATGEHHVRAVARTVWYHTGHHVNVIVSRTAGTVHCDERLPAKSYSIYPALDEVAAQVYLSDSVKRRRLVPNLSIARANAIERR